AAGQVLAAKASCAWPNQAEVHVLIAVAAVNRDLHCMGNVVHGLGQLLGIVFGPIQRIAETIGSGDRGGSSNTDQRQAGEKLTPVHHATSPKRLIRVMVKSSSPYQPSVKGTESPI